MKKAVWIGALLGAAALVTVTNLEAFNPWAEPPPTKAEVQADAQHLVDEVVALLPEAGRGEPEAPRSYPAACNKSWTIVSWSHEVRIDYDDTTELNDLRNQATASLRSAGWHVNEYKTVHKNGRLGATREPGDKATTVTVTFEPASFSEHPSIAVEHVGPCVKVDPLK